MSTSRPMFVTATMITGLALVSSPAFAAGAANPIDEISNPARYDYTDVSIAPRQMHEPFVRDGVVLEPQRFQSITTGLQSAQVQTLLGNPVRQSGREWDYNFKFRMTHSQNFLVCQYKIIFDENNAIQSSAWRRRQCEQLVKG